MLILNEAINVSNSALPMYVSDFIKNLDSNNTLCKLFLSIHIGSFTDFFPKVDAQFSLTRVFIKFSLGHHRIVRFLCSVIDFVEEESETI